MKKYILSLFILPLLLMFCCLNHVNALEYECSISGDDVLRAKTDEYNYEEWKYRYMTKMYVDISNIENIDSLTMYINYDREKVGLSNCNRFNYIGEGCPIATAKNNNIYYDYKYSDGLSEQINNYNFYTVTFMPKDTTPKIGETNVEVFFENAKDKDGNSISIKPCSKIYKFRKMAFFITTPVIDDITTQVVGISDKTYDGNFHTQDLKVMYYDKELEKDVDYSVSYENNKNAGTATIIVRGIGLYEGELTKTFEINPININDYAISGIVNKIYNGRNQTQNVKVVFGDKTLKNGADYLVSYKNNKNVGTATITITGTGNYIGTITKTFKINKANNPLAVKTSVKTVKRSKVRWKAQTVKAITVSKNQGKVKYYKTSGSSKITVNKTTGKLTVKKKTKKGTYKIKVKVIANGNSNYKSGYKIVTVKIRVK